jgi:hypothetical protein
VSFVTVVGVLDARDKAPGRDVTEERDDYHALPRASSRVQRRPS